MSYYTYILRCEDGSLYSGITTDPARRFAEHAGEKKRGAKYTALRKPIRYEALWLCDGRSCASKLESKLKKLSHAQKEQIIAQAATIECEGCRREPL